ncbi:MAG: prepilin-type N-terminal cleavage/methylation domain-containing protein [Eubacteriales bacterium]|nr:prepilin-type N-terminal cleavage/methylation domain-containing protein [Eubacteriales bacterium]
MKSKFNNSKRGFTIVELVIVIAIIAILAAVLIPTFSSLVQSAQMASDTSLITNLNKELAMA